jgi:hypothetical protein
VPSAYSAFGERIVSDLKNGPHDYTELSSFLGRAQNVFSATPPSLHMETGSDRYVKAVVFFDFFLLKRTTATTYLA